jgi:hypothetical protein
MSFAAVSCTKCHSRLPVNAFNSEGLFQCPYCAATLQADIFPALFRPIATGKAGEATMEETEASCFYHPEKKAVLPCDACGRFMCALCDCDLNGQHICPSCLEAGRTKGKIKSLENKRVIYDDMALGLAIFSLVPPIIYFCWVTAPLAIYISIRHWKSPGSVVRRTKIRFIFAIIIALLDIAALVGLIMLIVNDARRHR